MSLTLVAKEKIFNQKNVNNFVGTPLDSRVNIYINFLPSSYPRGIFSLILISLFATGVADTGGKFAAGVVDTGGNLPPVSLTPAVYSGAWGKLIHEKNQKQKIS